MVRVGVLALQGSFREHVSALKRCSVDAIEVRTLSDLSSCDGLIIPGGESTTMAHVAEKTGMLDALREFVKADGRCVWGTCAGLIFLARQAEGAKEGGQKLLQCLDVRVSRNFFGAQICCFEQQLPAHELLRRFGEDPTYRAVFIRAPAILAANKEHVTVLSEYKLSEEEQAKAGQTSVIVAAKSGNMLATAFHPELTEDLRWHKLFVDMVTQAAKQPASEYKQAAYQMRPPTMPADLPLFGSVHPCA